LSFITNYCNIILSFNWASGTSESIIFNTLLNSNNYSRQILFCDGQNLIAQPRFGKGDVSFRTGKSQKGKERKINMYLLFQLYVRKTIVTRCKQNSSRTIATCNTINILHALTEMNVRTSGINMSLQEFNFLMQIYNYRKNRYKFTDQKLILMLVGIRRLHRVQKILGF